LFLDTASRVFAKMPYLHQYDYIFAIGSLFAFLDAFNNGASEHIPTSFILFVRDY